MFLVLSAVAAYCAADVDGLRRRADALHSEGKNDSALTVAAEAAEAALRGRDTVALVGLYSSMGVYLRTMGRLDEALARYGEALAMCTTEGYRRRAGEQGRQEAAGLYLNLATLHVDLQHKKEAAYYARLAAEWAGRCSDKAFKAQLLAQDGLIMLMCGDNAAASAMLSEAYSTAVAGGDHASALSAAAYMVAVADRSGGGEAEALWRGRCRELEGKVGDTMALVAYYQIMCSLEMNHGRWRQAIALFDKILSTKGVDGMPFVVYDCYNNMHDAWAGLGEWRKAYECLGKAAALKDSLFEADKAESMRELDVKYQAKEKELALARSEADLARTRMYLAFAALVMLVCVVLVSMYVQAQRRKAREREAEFARLKADTDRRLTQRYVEGLESERLRLAKELHDGVCNDLYTVELVLSRQVISRQVISRQADKPLADKLSADKLSADKPLADKLSADKQTSRRADKPLADKLSADKQTSRQADEPLADELLADKQTGQISSSAGLLVDSSAEKQVSSSAGLLVDSSAEKQVCSSAGLLVDSSAEKQVDSSAEKTVSMLRECRERARRISHELMPPEFSYADISLVLEDYVARTAEASGCDITFAAEPADADWGGVADAVALELYRITQEALANALKHSGAGRVSVALGLDGGVLTLAVADDGNAGGKPGAGIGRRTMKQRADSVGGKLAFERADGKNIVKFIFSMHN